MARNGKCTDELIEMALKYKKSGMSDKDMCLCLGIGKTTFYRWMDNPTNRKQREFRDKIKRAEPEFKAALRARIIKQSEKSWQAAAWMLERMYPDEYARTQRISGTVETIQKPDALTEAIMETARKMEGKRDE